MDPSSNASMRFRPVQMRHYLHACLKEELFPDEIYWIDSDWQMFVVRWQTGNRVGTSVDDAVFF